MRIGELAKATGKSVAALRYYEQAGLLPETLRTESGYRDYAVGTVERVRFIVHAQGAGFSLKEIRSVLAMYDRGVCPCEDVAEMARQKVSALDGIILDLLARRASLAEAVRSWETDPAASEAGYCPILDFSRQTNRRYSAMAAKMIEVFTAGCPLCDEAIKNVQDAVAPCGCTVVTRKPDSAEARQYGISAVPTIVAGGQVVFTGTPTPEQAVALLRQ